MGVPILGSGLIRELMRVDGPRSGRVLTRRRAPVRGGRPIIGAGRVPLRATSLPTRVSGGVGT